MLTQLSIKNYALINDIRVDFTDGFSTITGETGAGKSILLGGLSLALGNRADLSSLRNDTLKCIIEAEFDIANYQLEKFFQNNDLDFEANSILRREILPSGKSRAFINDTPVTLDILKKLGSQLVDVHSQHQTLQLTNNAFQLRVVDALAKNQNRLKDYRKVLAQYRAEQAKLKELEEFQSNSLKEHDYNTFLWEELEAANLQEGMLAQLEEEQQQLDNVERILQQLAEANQIFQTETIGVLAQLDTLRRALQTLSEYGTQYENLSQRMESVHIEMDDMVAELEQLSDSVEANPERLDQVNALLQKVYDLQKKHQVDSIAGLLEVKQNLAEKVDAVVNIDTNIEAKRSIVTQLESDLKTRAIALRDARNAVIPKLKTMLQEKLYDLGMPSATFKINISPAEAFNNHGKDELVFLFSANQGSAYGELKKVASGGELSRIMLTIKSILAEYEKLPTLMFDEIDTGVSGEISNKMGEIMQDMGHTMQVFSITHLPQVASKGKHQYKVYKEEREGETFTQMKQLDAAERVQELAEMLGGKTLSDSAMAHAKSLLGQS
ncbi:MAG: DNA repair protein RecN [Bacteroidota bacterium]